jgi:hypothetical protein
MDELLDWHSPVEGSLDRVTFPGGKLDEICGSQFAHLEHMGGSSWFLLVGHDDGTETAVWFRSKDLRQPSYERRPPRKAASEAIRRA